MSPVIAFDISVVAQKVKVQCWGPVWPEKVVVLGQQHAGMAIRAPDGANYDCSIDNWNQITSTMMIVCWRSPQMLDSTLSANLDLCSCFTFQTLKYVHISSPTWPFITNYKNGDEHKFLENLEPSLERVWLPGSTLENVQELQERERSKILFVKY